MLTPKDAWQATLGQLELQLNRATFDTWLKGSEVLAYEDGEFVIRVRHAYAKDWLEQHLNSQIIEMLGRILGRSVTVNYVVHLPTARFHHPPAGPLFADLPSEAASKSEGPTAAEQPPASPPAADPPPSPWLAFAEWDPRVSEVRRTSELDVPIRSSARFDARYTFDSFVTGPSNHFAFAAAQAVAGTETPAYNPLFIYGGVGLGKTHLLHAIGQVTEGAGKNVIYVTAETFTNEMVAAIRGKTMDEFRSRYRTVDVLLIDDAQFVAGKISTEEEFYHTFNAVFSRGGKIALASDVHPRSISGLDERLRSRFEGGLLADIQAPEYETRHRIVKAKSAAQDVTLPDDIAELMARHETDNVRELEGLLTQVLARTKLTKEPLTLALAQAVLNKNSARPPQPTRRATSIDQVLQATAKYHQLSMDDLLSKRRTKAVVRARQIAMYLAREETAASFPQIGAALGGRNHSTVLHGYQKIAGEVDLDEELRREVSDIRRQLNLSVN